MNHMIKYLHRRTGAALAAALVVCAPLALIAPATPVAAQTSSGDLDAAVAALRGITTMQASFTQTDRNGQRMSGTLTMKQPGRMRFQYQPGIPLLIVADGKALTLVDYEVKQVQRWPIKNSPLGALLDPTRDVKTFGTLQSTGDPGVVSVEVRDRKHPEYGVITLIFTRNAAAPGGLELVSWVALDSQNQRTTIRLSGHRYGLAVNDNMFRYNDPRTATRR
jgi:outer membrane lipoprotein-sorting protein